MMEYLKDTLRAAGRPGDNVRADVVEAMLQSRGQDVSFPPHYKVVRVFSRETPYADIDQDLSWGGLLRDIRVKKGLSQTQLADLLGYDQSYISKFEIEKRRPVLPYLETFINAMDLDPDIDGIY